MEKNKCKNCGQELDNGGDFCGFCGAKVVKINIPSKGKTVAEKKSNTSVRILIGCVCGIVLVGITIGLLFLLNNKNKSGSDTASTSAYISETELPDNIVHPDPSALLIASDSAFSIPEEIKKLINTEADPTDYINGYSGYSGTMTVLYTGAENITESMLANEYTQEEIDAVQNEYDMIHDVSISGSASINQGRINALFSEYQADPVLIWDSENPLESTEPGIYGSEETVDHTNGSTYHCKKICFLNDGSIFVLIGTAETVSGEQVLTKEIRILLIPNEEVRPEHHNAPETSTESSSVDPTGSETDTTASTSVSSETDGTQSSSETSSADTGTTSSSTETSEKQTSTETDTSSTTTQDFGKTTPTSYNTSELPSKNDFAWYFNDVKKNGVWSGVTKITDYSQISGGWKCSIVYNQSETITMECREDVNLEISGNASSVVAKIHWGSLYIEGEDTIDETYIDDTEMSGSFNNGTLSLTGPCDITFTQFFIKDGKQYSVGSLSSSEGESAVVILVRP